jgi:hypothetical protein
MVLLKKNIFNQGDFKKNILNMFDNVIAVAFQIIFRAEMHVNDFFYF